MIFLLLLIASTMEPTVTSGQRGYNATTEQNIVTPDQLTKIKRDLDVVQSNMAVFSEILSEMKPGSENPSDVELLEVMKQQGFHISFSSFRTFPIE